MNRSDLDYPLPEELIAQAPAEPRDAANLWVQRVGHETGWAGQVRDLASHLAPEDLLVFNNTKVLPARVWAQRESGARVELLFLEPLAEAGLWKAMVRPAKKPKAGEWLQLGSGMRVEMIRRELDAAGEPGATWQVRAQDPAAHGRSTETILEAVGEMPLPPYIKRAAGQEPEDRERYQTVFARELGAVAAPTAGLHFTLSLLDQIRAQGIATAEVTLHVGLGTFLPIQAERIEDHAMHSERFEISEAVVAAVEACRARGGRVIAVGTTSARALEAAAQDGPLQACRGRTDLFITPGYSFRVVQGLFTNFHLPGSTLLLLVSAFAGEASIRRIYSQAIERRWRFYSYGDAMLLLR